LISGTRLQLTGLSDFQSILEGSQQNRDNSSEMPSWATSIQQIAKAILYSAVTSAHIFSLKLATSDKQTLDSLAKVAKKPPAFTFPRHEFSFSILGLHDNPSTKQRIANAVVDPAPEDIKSQLYVLPPTWTRRGCSRCSKGLSAWRSSHAPILRRHAGVH